MQVSSPTDVNKVKYGAEVEALVAEIEKHLLGRNVLIEHDDGERFIKYEVAEQEWIEPPIQQAIKELYEGQGWDRVEFRNSLTIQFFFPRINL